MPENISLEEAAPPGGLAYLELADRLVALAPPGFGRVFAVNPAIVQGGFYD